MNETTEQPQPSNELTPQQTFDTIVLGLRRQGKLSRVDTLISSTGLKSTADDGPFCRYLSPDGSRCAAGQLMDPEVIRAFEQEHNCVGGLGGTVTGLWMGAWLSQLTGGKLPNNSTRSSRLAADLQIAHDTSETMEAFIEKATLVAVNTAGIDQSACTQVLEPVA